MKSIIHGSVLAILAIIPLTGASATATEEVFAEWLVAFNSGKKTAIQGFYGKWLADPDAAHARHLRTETCGFELVRVEDASATSFSALLAERCFPALRRMTFSIPESGVTLKNFSLRSFAMSDGRAIAATKDFAERLTKLDEFAGSVVIAKDGLEPWSFNSGTLSRDDGTPISAERRCF